MAYFLYFLQLNFLASIPQLFVYWLFCFSFINPQPPKLIKRIALIAVIHSLYTDSTVLILPIYLHLFNSTIVGFILLWFFFRDLMPKQRIVTYLFVLVFSIVMDLVLSTIVVYILGVPSREAFLTDDFLKLLSVMYPQLFVILAASWFIRARKNNYGKKIFSILLNVEKSTLTQVSTFIVIQFILLAALQLIQITTEKHNYYLSIILVYLIILVSLLALVTIIRLFVRTREQAAKTTQEVYIDDINDMFTSIRGQRHDFLNHVQVIHTMVQMGRTEQLKSYVGDLVKETRELSDIVHHSSPALAAFVQAKIAVSLGKGIQFAYELPDKWEAKETTVKVVDIIKIIGNLVDNAFDETMNLPPEERHVFASIRTQEDGSIELEVSNRSRVLTSDDRRHIFKPGYTTKGDGHSGLGLAIVQERVKHYKGALELLSDEKEGVTVFKVSLPAVSA